MIQQKNIYQFERLHNIYDEIFISEYSFFVESILIFIIYIINVAAVVIVFINYYIFNRNFLFKTYIFLC
jgi:hypothetical protein